MAKETKAKQTLLIGALTSSFGVFVSKALGLIYYSPLSSMAGEANMAFYSISYTYYDVLLKISGAGIPFAIAALVAKYCAKDDYKTAMLVRKLGTSIIMGMSCLVGLVFLMFSGKLASQSMGLAASVEDINTLKTLFVILTAAVIVVPYLSSIRGYYQGLKRLDLYASSQVLEQFTRVFFILIFGYVCVKILKFDSIWAIFMAMAAAAVAAISSIVFIKANTKEEDRHINELINNQESSALAKKEIVKEILFLGLPYIIISFFGSASTLVNTTFFLDYATSIGYDYYNSKLSLGILQANCNKLLAIPQVLTLGFSSGLVPYLTESLEKQDFEKLSDQMTQIFETVLYLLIPAILVFYFFAKDIYFIMYGNANLALGAKLFSISTLIGFTDTIAPILSSIMITLKLKKQAILILILSFISKLISFFPCVKVFGAPGIVYSTFICSMVAVVLYYFTLEKTYDFKGFRIIKTGLKSFACALIMIGVAVLIHSVLPIDYSSRVLTLIFMAVLGVVMVVVYFFLSSKFKLPQYIFGIEDLNPKTIIKKFRVR